MMNLGGAGINITADDSQARSAFGRLGKGLKSIETLIRKVSSSNTAIEGTGRALQTMGRYADEMASSTGKAYRQTSGYMSSMSRASRTLQSDSERTQRGVSNSYNNIANDAGAMANDTTKAYRQTADAMRSTGRESTRSHNEMQYETRETRRYMQGLSEEAQRMKREMSAAARQSKYGSVQLREDAVKNQYAYHKLAESSKEYQGTTDDFMNDLLKLGKEDERIKKAMMANNDHMKANFFKTVGAMMARSSQASKISDNFKKMGGIANTVNRPLLAIADKFDRISRMGTPAALALKQLGPTASMKELNDRMMLITQGIMRFQGVALAAAVAAGIFYGALHKGAMKASKEYKGAFKGMTKSIKAMFEPLIDMFARLMVPVYKAIKFVADLVVEFQKANPVLTKIISAMVVLVPLLTLILSPLAVGIGLWAGLQAAMAASSTILAPLITGFASIMGTVALVAVGLVALGAAFVLLYKRSSEFRAVVKVLQKGIMIAFKAIYDYVDRAIKKIKEIGAAISRWEGFIPVLMGLVTAFTTYYTILGLVWARKKLVLAVTKAYMAIQKLSIALQGAYTAAMIAFNAAGGGMKGVLMALRAAQLKLNLAMVANPIGLVIALVAGLVVGLVIAYKKSETFRKIVDGAFSAIKKTAKTVFDWFKNELPALARRFKQWADDSYANTVGKMRDMVARVVQFFKDLKRGADNSFNSVTKAIRSARDAVVQWFSNMVKKADELYAKTIGSIRKLRDGVVNGIKAAWDKAGDLTLKATKFIVQLLVNVVKTYVYIFKNWKPLLKDGVSALWEIVKAGFRKIGEFISNTWNKAVSLTKSLAKRMLSAIKSTWSSFSKYVVDRFKALLSTISRTASSIVKYMRELPGRMKNAIVSTYKTFHNWFVNFAQNLSKTISKLAVAIVKFMRDLPGRMKNAIVSTYKKFYNWFLNFAQNMRNTISKLATAIVKYMKELPGRMKSALQSTWSKIRNAVYDLAKYLLARITDSFKKIVTAARDLAGRMANAVRSTWRKIKDTFISLMKSIRDYVSSTFTKLVSWASALPGRIGSAVKRAASKTYSAVASLASGMKKRMTDTFNSIVDGARKLPGRMGDGMRKLGGKALSGVKSVGNSMLGGMGKAVNGLVGGINTILSKLDIKDRIPKWKVPKYAQGTQGHPGGPAILGDGGGRELFRTPQGLTGLSPATDTLYNLPKGTSVLSAPKTKKFLGKVPKYASGVGDFFSNSMDWASDKYNKAKNKAADIKDFFKENVKDIWDYASNPSKLVDLMVKKLSLKVAGGKGVAKIAGGGMNLLIKKTREFIKSKFDMFSDDSGGVNVFKGLTKTQGFGKAGGSNGYFHHDGVDFAGPLGTFIKSVTSGKVSFAGPAFQGYGGGFGNLVKVASGAYEHFYGHLQKVLATKGQPVTAGQSLIGKLGSTGNSTGPHVHYEVRKNGTPVDPMPFLTGKKLGGNVRSWIKKAMSIAGVKGDNWANGLYTVAMGESTGDPNKVNNWDSNARAGIPSKGLMQMIPPTFSAHMKKGYGNIFNPIDNIIASIDYIQDRYKGISNVPGVIARRLGRPYVGYETGGFINHQQVAMLGEGNKREVVIPLENRRYMKPFSDAVAKNLEGQGGQFSQVNNFNGARVLSPREAARLVELQSKKFAEKL